MIEGTYDNVEIEYSKINDIRIGNLVYFKSIIWQVYDFEDDTVYLLSPNKENIGVLNTEILPILISPEVMELCGFKVFSNEDEPLFYIGKNEIQTKTVYTLKNSEFNIDLKLKVIMNYAIDANNNFIINTLNEISNDDKSLKYLHQVQNIFKDMYKFELIVID